jgi:uncharacterized protein (TIGR00369 family)
VTAGFEELLERGFAPHLLGGHMGVQVLACGDGKARLRMPFRSHYLQNMGVVQGGVIATICDMTMAWAVLSQVHPRHSPTIDLTVSYLRPVTEQDLECEAIVLRAGRSVAYARAEVMTLDGVLVATATGSFLVRDREEAGTGR